MNKEFYNLLDEMIKNPKCSLEYNNDYELLIAIMLSAQCSDERVNKITKILFNNRTIYDIAIMSEEDIKNIIFSLGNMNKKSKYIKSICNSLIKDHNGIVPNDRKYIESLPGIGHKTCNVFLNEIYKEPSFAVDTHVQRVSKRLGLVNEYDNIIIIENKLMNLFPKEKWGKLHHQFVLFGRNICKSKKPVCEKCLISKYCKKMKDNIKK